MQTKDMLVKVMGGRPKLGLALYAGAIETPTREFPLNLHERLAFWVGSWEMRANREWNPEQGDVHGVFTHAFSRGYPRLGVSLRPARVPEKNPYPGNTFHERVNSPSVSAQKDLLERLEQPVRRYSSEEDYAIRSRGGPVELLWFMNYSMRRMKSSTICSKFAEQTAKILDSYPTEYELPEQGTLF